MLIIPIQDKFSWRSPPLMIFALVLINICLFSWLEKRDDTTYQQMESIYFKADLSTKEWPLYLEYLNQHNQKLWTHLVKLKNAKAINQVGVYYLWHDLQFDNYLNQHWLNNTQPSHGQWQHVRERFIKQREQLSSYQYGLTPSSITIVNIFTYQFMHGNWSHLLSNMAFLLLFGFALEKRLGAARCLLFYLACGTFAGLSHALYDLNSSAPLVGASGAISGLMGMYLAAYGVKPIEFFYSIGFYFGSFRAPALIVLPFWLGKELFGATFSQDNVAYMAHAGGMVTGLLLVNAYRLMAKDKFHHSEDEEYDPNNQVPHSITQLLETLEFERAFKSCQWQLQQMPLNQPLWHTFIDTAAKLSPEHLNEAIELMVKLLVEKESSKLLLALYQQLKELPRGAEQVSESIRFRVFNQLALNESLLPAYELLIPLIAGGFKHAQLGTGIQAFAKQLKQKQLSNELDSLKSAIALRREKSPA